MAHSIDPQILLENTGWLRGLATQLAGDPDRGEDAVQDTWLAFASDPPRATRGPRLRAWLARTVRHAALGASRARSRRERREEARATPERIPSVTESVERVELQERIVSAVMALRSPDREIVVLRYFEDLPPRDIAAQLSLSPNAVRTRLSRALHRLRGALDDTYGGRKDWALTALPWASTSWRAPIAMGVAGGLLMKTTTPVVVAILVIGGLWFAVSGERSEIELDQATRNLDSVELLTPPYVQVPAESIFVEPQQDADSRVAIGEQRVEDDAGAPPAQVLRLEGRCVDELGRPLANVRAVARSTDAPPQYTANDGTFSIEVSGGTWGGAQLYLDFMRVGLADCWTTVQPTRLGVLPVPDVIMWRGSVLKGRVVDDAGAPLAHVSIVSVHPWPEDDAQTRDRARAFGERTLGLARTSTDEDGAYLLTGVPVEIVRVQATLPDHLVSFSPPIAVEPERAVAVPTIIVSEPGPEDVIRGKLLDPDGNPVPNARLLMRATNGDPLQQKITWLRSEAGAFALLAAHDSTYSLEATDQEMRWGPARLGDVRAGDDVVLRYDANQAELFVHDPEGEPVPDFQLRFWLENNTPVNANVRVVGPGRRAIALPGEPFTVQIQAHGFRTRSLGALDPNEIEGELAVVLERLDGLHGRVVANGQPVPNAAVHAHSGFLDQEWLVFGAGFACRLQSAWTPPCQTAEDGSFFAPIPEPGSYMVHVVAPGYALTELGPVVFEQGQGAQPLELELGIGGVLAGRVLTAPGVSPNGWTIAISRGDAHIEDTLVDTSGEYRFEHLTPGNWQVLRLLPDEVERGMRGGWRAQEPDVAPVWDAQVTAAGTARFNLDLRDEIPCRIHGLVRIGDSTPIGLRVLIANGDTRKRPSLDPTGRYSVMVPRPGTYRLNSVFFPRAGLRIELTDQREIQPGDNEWTIDLPGGTVELTSLDQGETYGLVREDEGTLRWFARIEATNLEEIVIESVPAGSYRWTGTPSESAGAMPHAWPVLRTFELAPEGHAYLR